MPQQDNLIRFLSLQLLRRRDDGFMDEDSIIGHDLLELGLRVMVELQ